MYNLISFFGMFGLMAVAWIFSKNRKNINWRVVGWGAGLQIIFAFFIFKVPAGIAVFNLINKAVLKMFSFAKEGINFCFGPLSIGPGAMGPYGEQSIGFILAIQSLPTVIFFSAIMSLLYFVKFMPLLINIFARIFTKLMKISGAEALCSSSNIFVGVESAFTIRPYLEKMTKSELCTVLTAGMATIASTMLGLYASFLYGSFPAIAGHLVSASILSAPAAIVMAKLLYPEDEVPETLGENVKAEYIPAQNWMDAIIKGANEGLKLCAGIIALLIAVLGLLAIVNYGFGKIGTSLQEILSYIFRPLVFLTGVPMADISKVAYLAGERTIVTELVAYQHLSAYIQQGAISARSAVIASYILCGFAHIASMAIFVGGFAAIAPSRSGDLAKIGFRALAAAILACLMTGAVAGVFYTSGILTVL
ncbi:MAG: nucleoside transporter [Elusimicrobia bacterium RIFOXYA2_FULL_39_19]|nr:MAG: nucleoside transporter [Elusimicrobia bacterium RIFOXYA2_FULL_39_19]